MEDFRSDLLKRNPEHIVKQKRNKKANCIEIMYYSEERTGILTIYLYALLIQRESIEKDHQETPS